MHPLGPPLSLPVSSPNNCTKSYAARIRRAHATQIQRIVKSRGYRQIFAHTIRYITRSEIALTTDNQHLSVHFSSSLSLPPLTFHYTTTTTTSPSPTHISRLHVVILRSVEPLLKVLRDGNEDEVEVGDPEAEGIPEGPQVQGEASRDQAVQ